MQDAKEKIFETVNATERFKRVSSKFPKDFSILPCATIDIKRAPLMHADDEPYLWGYKVNIDIWAETDEEADELTGIVEETMGELGLWTVSVSEMQQADVSRIRLSYNVQE